MVFALVLIGEATHVAGTWNLWWIAALATTFAGDLTDFLDGKIARREGGGTELGKLADPFTDSVFRLCVFFAITIAGPFPAWGFLLLVIRDSSNGFLRQISALRGIALGARWSGKVKAWVQGIGAYFILGEMILNVLPEWVIVSGCAFIALFTAGSGIDYLWANRHVFRQPHG